MKNRFLYLVFLTIVQFTTESYAQTTYVTFSGKISAQNLDTSTVETALGNGLVEIYFDSYQGSNLKGSCDCSDEAGKVGTFSCSVNISGKAQKVILVFKASGHTQKVKDYLVAQDKSGEVAYEHTNATLFKLNNLSTNKFEISEDENIIIFKNPRFDEDSTEIKKTTKIFFHSIEKLGTNVKGRFLYYPDKLIEADGVWFKVSYRLDSNLEASDVKLHSGYVYYNFTKEYKQTIHDGYIYAQTGIDAFDMNNYSIKTPLAIKAKEKHRFKIRDSKNQLLLLPDVEKCIIYDREKVKLLTAEEVLRG